MHVRSVCCGRGRLVGVARPCSATMSGHRRQRRPPTHLLFTRSIQFTVMHHRLPPVDVQSRDFFKYGGKLQLEAIQRCIVAVPYSKRTMTLAAVGATISATIQCPAETLILLGGLFQHPLTCQPIVNVRYLAQMSGASRVKPRDR